MKVLYFHQHFSTPAGSTGIRSYEMARRLIYHKHEVTMVCGSYQGAETGLDVPFVNGRRQGVIDGIRIIEFDLAYSNCDSFFRRSLVFVKFALRSASLAFSEKYDVLFATTTPLTAGIPGIFSRWLRGKPFVFEVRDLWPELPKQMGAIKNPVVLQMMSVLEWISYHSAHRCIGLSPGIVDGIVKRGVNRSKVDLIPNGCDLNLFGTYLFPWRPEGISEKDLMVVYTGTHGIANGLDAVLDAAVVLKCRGYHAIKILLIGQGRLKPTLQLRVEKEGLDNVIFHDPVNKSELAGLLASADIGMQILANFPAFYFGTSPNKFFDYIAAGLPVLNNYPGWVAQMIDEYECGYVVPPDCPEKFGNALIKAFNNRECLKSMGEQSMRLAEQKFNRRYLADHFVAALVKVVD